MYRIQVIGIMQASWPGLHFLYTVHGKSCSDAVWQCGENGVVPYHVLSLVKGHMFQEHCKIIPPKKWWYTTPVSLLSKTTNPNILITSDAHPDIDRKSILTSWCHGGVGAAIHPDMGITRVHNTVPCKSRLISKQDVSYNAFCEKTLAKHNPCTMVRWGVGLHSLDVVGLRRLLMGNSPDKGNTDNLQELQFFAHRFLYLLPLFSICEPLSRYWFLGMWWLGLFAHLS
jgi:hypothetical protein